MVKPKKLSRTAAAAWRRIVAECHSAGVAIEGKYDVLERYAVTYDMWLDCQAAIRTEGQVVDGSRNPRMVDLHKLTAALRSIRSELGLGPVTQRIGTRRRATEKRVERAEAEVSRPTTSRIIYKFGKAE